MFKSLYIQQVRDVQSFISQEVYSSIKTVRVDIHEKLTPVSIKEEQKLNISVVDYIPFENKTKSGQFGMNKIYNSRCLLRILWKLDHLDPIWVNESTNNFISSRDCSRWCKVNKISGRFLDE